MFTMTAHKRHSPVYTPHAPHPAITQELAAFFNGVAPQASLLTPGKCTATTDKLSAAPSMPYSAHGNDVSRMAELRIRQWIVQQEQDLRKQQHKRLFDAPK